jgi:hypothetical protein
VEERHGGPSISRKPSQTIHFCAYQGAATAPKRLQSRKLILCWTNGLFIYLKYVKELRCIPRCCNCTKTSAITKVDLMLDERSIYLSEIRKGASREVLLLPDLTGEILLLPVCTLMRRFVESQSEQPSAMFGTIQF